MHLTDLSKVCDCICHFLLVAILYDYRQSFPTLKIIQYYLLNQKQVAKIGSSHSTWENIIFGVSQGCILGSLLIEVSLSDLFLEHKDCCFFNNADDATPYMTANNIAEELASITKKLYTWFANNQIKVNHDKRHLLLGTRREAIIEIANTTMQCCKSKKSIGKKLKSGEHIENIYRKASRKLNAFARLTNYAELPKRCILMNVFLRAQFNDCSVVWVFHTRSQRNKVNRLHERCLKIIYNDKHSRFEKLLVTDNSVCIHHNNIHIPATKMCSSPNGMSLEIMNETFR